MRRLLVLAPLLFTSCVPAWSAREIAGKADKGIVSRMAGEWEYRPAAALVRGDALSLTMRPGRTPEFQYEHAGNLERWAVNPVRIGNRTFADVKLLASANDSTTNANWSVPADTLRRYHLFARLDVSGDSLLVGFLDDDATTRWLDANSSPLSYGSIETHGTDLTLFDRSDRMRALLRVVQDEDSLFTEPILLRRSRLEGRAATP